MCVYVRDNNGNVSIAHIIIFKALAIFHLECRMRNYHNFSEHTLIWLDFEITPYLNEMLCITALTDYPTITSNTKRSKYKIKIIWHFKL